MKDKVFAREYLTLSLQVTKTRGLILLLSYTLSQLRLVRYLFGINYTALNDFEKLAVGSVGKGQGDGGKTADKIVQNLRIL